MDLSLLFPIIILLLFIPLFLSSRKQKRQMTEMQQLQNSLEAGDVVSTTSGLRGTVVDASYEDTIDLEIADGVVTTWVRAAIREKITTDAAEAAPETPAVTTAAGAATPETAATPDTVATTDPAATPDKVDLEKDESTNGSPRA